MNSWALYVGLYLLMEKCAEIRPLLTTFSFGFRKHSTNKTLIRILVHFFLGLYTSYYMKCVLIKIVPDSHFAVLKMAVVLNRNRCFCMISDLLKPLRHRAGLQTTSTVLQDIPKASAFDNPQVKSLLRRLTGRNLDKVLATRRERGLESVSYKLMTDEELATTERNSKEEAERFLEMPPVMEERKDTNIVLERRLELDGYSDCNFIFTDISEGKINRDRHIVVHQPDGTLRKGHWEERDRMNFLFFPKDGQSYRLPQVLHDEYLQNAFNRDGHVDVLDLVCNQREPDSADYIRVHKKTYKDINTRRLFHLLRSTRHFGGMVYYLTQESRVTWLLVDMLRRDLISDACDVVRLYHIIHPKCKSAEISMTDKLDGLELVKAYVNIEGPRSLLDFLPKDKMTAENI